MQKKFVLGIGLCLVLSLVFLQRVEANNSHVCENGEHIGNPHCQTPSPTPTKTPSSTPCFLWIGEFPQPCLTPVASPSVSPSASPTVTPFLTADPETGTQTFSNQLPQACGNVAPPVPQQVTASDVVNGSLTVHWIPTGGNEAIISYQVPGGVTYNSGHVPNTGVAVIGSLQNDRYYVNVEQINGCAPGPFGTEYLTMTTENRVTLSTLGSK